ncbi:MAG: endonuclease/exonuclease/phosphatase family protein, partial [bacterium]
MAEEITFKFLTLNVCHGGILMDQMLEFLTHEQADIMVFQEVNKSENSTAPINFHTNENLQKHFPSHNLVFDSGLKLNYLKDNILTEQGNTTLSRFPIIRHKLVYFNSHYSEFDSPLPGEKPDYRSYPKYMQKSWLNLGGRELLVINLHGAWDYHGNDTPERLSMTKTILAHAKESEYVIIAGDSNARYQTNTIQMLMSHYPSVLPFTPISTFNMRRKTDPGYAEAAVDILLTSPNL